MSPVRLSYLAIALVSQIGKWAVIVIGAVVELNITMYVQHVLAQFLPHCKHATLGAG